jgi:thiosulfate dehydrogenase (quinone) large subunit
MADDLTTTPSTSNYTWTNWTYGMLLVRAYMGVRLVLSGLEKIRKTGKDPIDFKVWYGNPGSANPDNLELGDGKMWRIGQVIADNTNLPLLSIKGFLMTLPIAMLVVGVCILLGVMNRIAWLAAGLIWLSLAFGQMLLPDEQTIQYLTSYLLVCGIGLGFLEHNRIRVTRF